MGMHRDPNVITLCPFAETIRGLGQNRVSVVLQALLAYQDVISGLFDMHFQTRTVEKTVPSKKDPYQKGKLH